MFSEAFQFIAVKQNIRIVNYKGIRNASQVCIEVTIFLRHKARHGKGITFINYGVK